MKKINELDLGFSDAQNYSQRNNKTAFNYFFVKNHYLDELLNPSIYFLIGEKGTGKTAYATYLSNNNYKNTKAITSFISATDYEKFYTIKKQNHLDLTGYVGMWKVILLLLLSKSISEEDKVVSIFNKSNLSELNKSINEYYLNAFSPEITNVMKIMDESEIIAKIISKHAEVGGDNKTQIEFTQTKFQHNLYYIEKSFSDSLSKLKLNKDIVLFIDGIDIRPDSIPYADYLECIKGLTDATWALNTSLFSNIKDSKGQLRVVLLLRPDIFNSLSLQNTTNKLLDNSVFLDWTTTYQTYKSSPLYEVAKRILSYQQENIMQKENDTSDIFELYFPWKMHSSKYTDRDYDTAFMSFLKISLSRPRDILVIMQYIRKIMLQNNYGEQEFFCKEIFESDEFQNKYSEYFMSSLKDQLSFYYSNVDFQHFLKLFDYFNDNNFTYSVFKSNYDKFVDYILTNADDIPEFFDDDKKLLQLLYDCNVIAAIEKDEHGNDFFHFSYREKDNSNIHPKVWMGDNITYRFHYGLYKKIRLGRF